MRSAFRSFIVLQVEELVGGGNLKSLVQRDLQRSRGGGKHMYRMRDAVRWLINVAQGLDYLHSSQPTVSTCHLTYVAYDW